MMSSKWIFKCRVKNMKIKGNQWWKYEDISGPSCMKNVEETQSHILVCDFFLGKKENISYIPKYGEPYNGDIKEQINVFRILKENYERRVSEDWYIASTAHVNCGAPPHVLLFAVLDVYIYIPITQP